MEIKAPIMDSAAALGRLAELCSAHSQIFVLTDNNTLRDCWPRLRGACSFLGDCQPMVVPAGEASKSIGSAKLLWGQLADMGADRRSLLINLGGGMATDLGGFVAATYMRGIDFVQIPTSLLAQVDASVGGKTGINLNGRKNIIGSFAEPIEVMVMSEFLETLAARERLAGFAEMLKHGIISGGEHWERLRHGSITAASSPEMIKQSIEIKLKVVRQDWKESGLRKILNLGHTIGHAIESFSMEADENPLLHGEAVAAGMYFECILAEKIGLLKPQIATDIKELIQSHFEIRLYRAEEVKMLINYMRLDKKNESGRISFSLPTGLGAVQPDIFVDEAKIIEVLL